jgi:hypothetical protein
MASSKSACPLSAVSGCLLGPASRRTPPPVATAETAMADGVPPATASGAWSRFVDRYIEEHLRHTAFAAAQGHYEYDARHRAPRDSAVGRLQQAREAAEPKARNQPAGRSSANTCGPRSTGTCSGWTRPDGRSAARLTSTDLIRRPGAYVALTAPWPSACRLARATRRTSRGPPSRFAPSAMLLQHGAAVRHRLVWRAAEATGTMCRGVRAVADETLRERSPRPTRGGVGYAGSATGCANLATARRTCPGADLSCQMIMTPNGWTSRSMNSAMG